MQDELMSALSDLPMTPTSIGAPTSTLDAAAVALAASTSDSVSHLPYELPPVFKTLGDNDSDDQKSGDDISQFSTLSILSASEMGIKLEPGVGSGNRINHDINNEGFIPMIGRSYGSNMDFARTLHSVPDSLDTTRAATTTAASLQSQTISALVSPTGAQSSATLLPQQQSQQCLNNGGGLRLMRTQSEIVDQSSNQIQLAPPPMGNAVFTMQPQDVTLQSSLLSHQLSSSTAPPGGTRNRGQTSSQSLHPTSLPVSQSQHMFSQSSPVSQHLQQQHQQQTGYTIPRYYCNELAQSYTSSSQTSTVMSSASYVGGVFPNSNCPWYPVPELEPVTRPYKPCVVCNDRSSGYHYGVSSCEGCKGFFRRSVQKNLQYVCNKDKNCIINKVTRNRCQYCRLHKCFSMGMSREAVRNDRNRKKKESSSSSVDGGDQLASSTSEAIELTPDDMQLMEAIRDAHRSTFPVPTHVEVVSDVSEEERLGMWDKIEELSTQGVKRIVHFAKRVPKFRDLAQKDQALLLKSAIMELVILRMASRFDTEGDSVLFSTGLRLTRTALQALGFDDITDTVVLFAQKMNILKVDDVEYAVLSSICLCSGDRSGLEEPRSVDRIQERILDLFRRYVKKTYPDQPRRFAKLLMKLTDLRGISVKGGDRIFHFIKSKSEGDMPPLIVELLNRDENVCIP